MSFQRVLPLWVFFTFAGNAPLLFLGANLTAIMRTKVPVEMQGCVFSARDTIQYSTIPIGLPLGGVLADHVFEPFMTTVPTTSMCRSITSADGRIIPRGNYSPRVRKSPRTMRKSDSLSRCALTRNPR